MLTIPLMTVAVALGAGVTWTTVDTADRSVREIRELDTAGRDVLRLLPVSSDTLPAALCHALQGVDGVDVAYGMGAVDQARLATGVLVTTQEATAGARRYLRLPPPRWPGAQVLTGATLSEREGFVSGGWLQFAADQTTIAAGQVARTTTLAQTARTTAVDDSVILELPLRGAATECRIEPVAGARLDVAAALPALAASTAETRVLPLRPDIETEDEPDRRLASIPGNLTTVGAGAVTALLVLAWWYVRRAEWALYRTFGLRMPAIGAIALLEWAIVCGLPLVVGGAWGIAASTPGSVDIAYELAALNLAAAGLISVAVVALWTAYARAFSAALALRGH